MDEHFPSPTALREFALETAAQLRAVGLAEAGDVMEAAANFATTSGWEWLGELNVAALSIRARFRVTDSIGARLAHMLATTTSRRPGASG